MNIKISKRLLKKHGSIEALFDYVDFYGEIDYHVYMHGQEPKKVTILHYLEDEDRYNPTKNHMILTI